jgi:hypothetical protein
MFLGRAHYTVIQAFVLLQVWIVLVVNKACAPTFRGPENKGPRKSLVVPQHVASLTASCQHRGQWHKNYSPTLPKAAYTTEKSR